MSIIRFEQLAFIKSEQEKINQYSERVTEIFRLFVKNTHLQLLAFHLWDDLIDLSTAYSNKDYSQFLLKKSEDLFYQFEELQNHVQDNDIQAKLAEFIKEKNIHIKNIKA